MSIKTTLLSFAMAFCTILFYAGCATTPSQERKSPPSNPWTTSDTEGFWASVKMNAKRLSTAPRTNHAKPQEAEGKLEAFGMKYLPNAFEHYQELREATLEEEANFRDTFPKGEPIDYNKGKIYDKNKANLAQAISELDRRRDELCHFYLLYSSGITSADELARIDESPICIMLPSIDCEGQTHDYEPSGLNVAEDLPQIGGKEREFADKHFPLSITEFDRLSNLYKEGYASLIALEKDCAEMDIVRGYGVLTPLKKRLCEIYDFVVDFPLTVKNEGLAYSLGERTLEQLDEMDRGIGIKLQTFEKRLSVRNYCLSWQKEHWTDRHYERIANREAPIFFLLRSMTRINESESRVYELGKYEVSIAQWGEVMGKEYNFAPLALNGDWRFRHTKGQGMEWIPDAVCETIALREKKMTSFATLEDRSLQPLDATSSHAADYPMSGMSLEDIDEFFRRLNRLNEVKLWLARSEAPNKEFRIPLAWKWSYACTASIWRGTAISWDGNRIVSQQDIEANAWVKGNSAYHEIEQKKNESCQLVFPFGTKPPNYFGLYDMVGNLRELVDDEGKRMAMGGSVTSNDMYLLYRDYYTEGMAGVKNDALYGRNGGSYDGLRVFRWVRL